MNYYSLNTVSTVKSNILNYVETSDQWFSSNGFDILKIPNNLLDTTLLTIKFKFNGSAIVFKMNPNTFYRFHTDEHRQCAINLLLTEVDSNCYFGDQTDNEEVIENVTELKYESDRYYLLNTRKKHAVRNGNNVRYLLSMGFNNYDYETVKRYCQDQLI
jgi:hypothetical protein